MLIPTLASFEGHCFFFTYFVVTAVNSQGNLKSYKLHQMSKVIFLELFF